MKFLGEPRSGSMAATTWSRNRYGQYTRNRSGRGGTPAHSVAGAVAAWQALSATNQLGWIEWAARRALKNSLGQTREVSGYNAFVSAWIYGALVGVVPSAPPAGTETSTLTAVDLTNLTSSLVQLEGACEPSGSATGWLEFQYCAHPCTTGTNFPPGRNNYWKTNAVWPVFFGVGAADTKSFTPTGTKRMFGRVRLIRSDLTAGAWFTAGPVTIS